MSGHPIALGTLDSHTRCALFVAHLACVLKRESSEEARPCQFTPWGLRAGRGDVVDTQ